MQLKLNRALCATSALATGLLLASGAFAQSTGTAVVEEVVVTGSSGPQTQRGAIVAVEAPKSRASITQEFIATQLPSQTILQTINLMPGVNFTNNDAYGSAGGDITLRGFDSQRISLLQDGVPLNDSGNYAIYPNQQMDSDLISKVDVNLGTTDVDSPTAAAAGGTINYVTRKPQDQMGGRITIGAGSDQFQQYYGVFETGRIGPLGTKAWISANYAKNNIFDAPGQIEKKQFNARVWQDIGGRGDFVSLIANYNENRNAFIRRISLAQFNQHGVTAANLPDTTLHYDATCARPTPVNGTVQNEATTATGFTATCANYVGNNINPSNTGNIRGQSSFHLTDDLILTVDPSFQYVLANGGGRAVFSETDPQFRGAVDL
ncbi:MAG TPA: TonB-dependent receptor plug domain-containing protein, partial [Phenylobacterium sp.]|nr:TonB-dependent receptor plug domain-containing protein [Phenylobacterium sp.]